MSVNFSNQYLWVLDTFPWYVWKSQNPTLIPIVIPSDKLQLLKKKLDDPLVSQFVKRDFIREIMGAVLVPYVKKHLPR